MDKFTIIVPEENREIIVVEESHEIEVPPERRTIEVYQAMALLGSKIHTSGDTRRWKINYDRCLENTAEIKTATVTSSSTSCTIGTGLLVPTVLGRDVAFYLTGGNIGETLTVTIQIVDSFSNTETNTIAYTVLAP